MFAAALGAHLGSDSTALVDAASGERITYRDLHARLNGVAAYLRAAGVRRGDIVSIRSDNSIEYAIAVYGILWYGAIANPLNVQWSPAELAAVVKHAGSKLVIYDEALGKVPGADVNTAPLRDFTRVTVGSRVEEVADIPDSAGAILLYTSGTTSAPKGVLLSRRNLIENVAAARNALPLERRHATLGMLPLFHVHGFVSDLSLMLLTGGTCVVVPSFKPAMLEPIERAIRTYAINSFSCFPFLLEVLASCRVDLKTPDLRFCVSGAAPLKWDLVETFQENYGVQVIPAYGMTECMNYCTISPYREIVPGSVGIPANIEVQIVDERGTLLAPHEVGELVIRGPSVMVDGYYKGPRDCYLDEARTWFKTGDLGSHDERGYFYIKGRRKNMAIRGATKVYLDDLDTYLARHAKIRDVASVRVDREDDELIVTCIVRAPGASLDAAEVLAHLSTFVNSDKLPDRIVFRDAIPRTATSKVKLGELQQLVGERT